ncbi:hypothetical protein ECANGB1_871 [Enterospora canceri]|uniref:Uncharacterized protein n=1 Tax=Enterospora canceri TaxID=1081671 RepID=A0A1Y1S807_9MICR|nr:hypothetical protein ECANGB1_871 [Enterospora canceri]
MFIVIVSLLVACFIVLYTIRIKKEKESMETTNPEFLKYIEEFYYEKPNKKKAQLLRAAKYLTEVSEALREEESSADRLYKKGLLSDEYMNKLHMKMEEEIFVEKHLIQREAEEIKPGFSSTIFGEAAYLPSLYKPVEKYKPRFDHKKFVLECEKLSKGTVHKGK